MLDINSDHNHYTDYAVTCDQDGCYNRELFSVPSDIDLSLNVYPYVSNRLANLINIGWSLPPRGYREAFCPLHATEES